MLSHGHDVTTVIRSLPGSGASDAEILEQARVDGRAVLTLNRRDFFRLHREQPDHAGSSHARLIPTLPGKPGAFTTRYRSAVRCAASCCA
jgi:uncharacterized protein DUF5615